MSKSAVLKPSVININNCYKSSFTLTFAIEVLGDELWQDCGNGDLDLGACEQGIKLQYQLYQGQSFDLDVAIWPHTAKIYCGTESCWVRIWQFLDRRWFTFSIRHAFAVRVLDFIKFEVLVYPSFGVGVLSPNAKSDKPDKVVLPPLAFGQRRYFAPVIEDLTTEKEKLYKFVKHLIWNCVVDYIPPSYLDGSFDVPSLVEDIRHQDAVLFHIQETILNHNFIPEPEVEEEKNMRKNSKEGKGGKDKDKKKADTKQKFGVRITGDTILAGTGRIVPFEAFGERPPDVGEIIVLISSCNLPAQDDVPIAFANIDRLFDAPLEEFKKLRITHLYTRWSLGKEIHDSELIDIQSQKAQKDIKFNDHHAIPLHIRHATEVTSMYLDNYYEVQLRGIRSPEPLLGNPTLFGYEKRDREFGNVVPPKLVDEPLDFLIATTRMDARSLAKGINAFIRGEYPLFPPQITVTPLQRETNCTNDLNLIGEPLIPPLIVPPSVVLTAQMTLEVSMGVVGCKPPRLTSCFSRLYFLGRDPDSIMAVLLKVGEINDSLSRDKKDEMLTGFALDTGDVLIFFLEGPRDRHILNIWDLTEEHYPKLKPIFSSSARYSSRIYGEMLKTVPFVVLKMYVPLEIILACPSVYARPALPVPARLAALKFGRLIQNEFIRNSPPSCELPTFSELKSFRLELCTPPRTFPVLRQPISYCQNTAALNAAMEECKLVNNTQISFRS